VYTDEMEINATLWLEKDFVLFFVCTRLGLLERMPILEKTINTPALANGDAQAGIDDEEQLPYPNNIGTRLTPTTSPTNQVLHAIKLSDHMYSLGAA